MLPTQQQQYSLLEIEKRIDEIYVIEIKLREMLQKYGEIKKFSKKLEPEEIKLLAELPDNKLTKYLGEKIEIGEKRISIKYLRQEIYELAKESKYERAEKQNNGKQTVVKRANEYFKKWNNYMRSILQDQTRNWKE